MISSLHYSAEVAAALQEHRPVVALESTIIAHGMPYPQNVQTAAAVEQIIRDNGATPATIAILNGKLHVGLNNSQLDELANAKNVWKVSLRDMPFVVSQGLHGATTVAATMRIAAMAGIPVFVTGGIGGVHRGAEYSMDISADLTEMAATSVAVVSAGIKSILDIGLTLEKLETLGVPVVTFNNDSFPSFYSRDSGYKSPLRLDTPDSIASLLSAKWSLGLNGSVLIANPIAEEHEVPFVVIEEHIRKALEVATDSKISGKEITPFLLKYIAERTAGESLYANIELVKNNARLGAQIAVYYNAIH
ncbi:MAG: Pseudouridine-5-phosphate glycosidase [Bacteroidota bacterium]|jgi:pseudouridine-5'-phosphate glycosidase